MAVPCVFSQKLHQNDVFNLSSTKTNSALSNSCVENCSAKEVKCNKTMQCRFAYATWCPVCEEERSKNIYHSSRRRSKSEGMEVERTDSYYTKVTNKVSCCQSEAGFNKMRYNKKCCYTFNNQSACEYSRCSSNVKQLYVNKRCESVHSIVSLDDDPDYSKKCLKSSFRSCENHAQPICNYFETRDWMNSSKENEIIPLHEQYYYEVEIFQRNLRKLKEGTDGRKCSIQQSELKSNSPCLLEVGSKRPRDNSPSLSSSSLRKHLPFVPDCKSSSCTNSLQSSEHFSLNSRSATSDSDLYDSGCEEEEVEEDIKNKLAVGFDEGAGSNEQVGKLHPGLRASLFSYVPPYIKFSSHDTRGAALPAPVHKLLKWKLSTITPVVVRKTIVNSNFKLVRKSSEWCGTWGKHMKSLCFKTLREYQKINHFPGTFQIGRKDHLWKNLFRLMSKFGKKEFGFIPRTYVLPQDSKLLRSAWEKNCGKEKWIVKPPASARGTGIKVIHKWTQIPKKCPLVVQKYIADPYLINGSKFDLRLYVLVTSISPLRIYMYDNGLVRFASVKYSNDMTSLTDRYMHLTNYSINKLSSQYTQNEDASACLGHKWSLQALWTYLEKDQQVDVGALQSHLVDLVIKTIISGESAISQLSSANLASRYCSYELFGVDVLLDENLRPWLLEVNISPSLHSSSPLDLAIKGPMVKDLMNIAGYQIPNKLSSHVQDDLGRNFGLDSSLCFDRRLYTTALSNEERLKHVTFQQSESREDYLSAILQDLTPDDVRHLIQYEDELTQLGNFQKIFPTTETYDYHKFFEAPRYYNMLFDAWEVKQRKNRREGISLLESLCQKKVHLDTTQIPPKRTKVSMSPSENELKNTDPSLQEDHLESCEEDATVVPDKFKEKWTVMLACGTICRASRSRSGKPGIVTKPYPRSAYIARRSVKLAHAVS